MSDLAYRDMGQTAERQLPAADSGEVRPVPRISIQAFCESPDLVNAIEVAARDRRMARAHVKVQTGGITAAAEFYRRRRRPT